MAFVRLNWDYADTTTIVGFRIYRDDILRAEIDRAILTYDDDTTDYTPTQAIYKVVAYDIFGKESLACASLTVQLIYSLIPIMTGQNTPSGEALASVGSTAGLGIITEEGYKYFDGLEDRLDWTSNSGGEYTSAIDIRVYYTWDTEQLIEKWGWIEHINIIGSDSQNYSDFILYGTNDINADVIDESIWTEIGRINALPEYAVGTRIVKETYNNGTKYKKIRVRFNGTIDTTNAYVSKISELLILGRP